jgi:porin
VVISGVARGSEYAQKLFGDWGGIRTQLAKTGVNIEASYINELAYNAGGGDRGRTADADQVYFRCSLDLQRIATIPGAKIVFP